MLYYYYIKNININYFKTTNNFVENLINKPINVKISTLSDYLEFENFF